MSFFVVAGTKSHVPAMPVLEKQGFEFRLGAITQEILDDSRARGVKLKSGEEIKADAVLFSAGVRSNLELVENSAIPGDRGILVNEKMETQCSGVYAAGDVAQFDRINYCIWPEAVDQGKVAGINMAGGDGIYKNIRHPS